jgi:hypothetical protein
VFQIIEYSSAITNAVHNPVISQSNSTPIAFCDNAKEIGKIKTINFLKIQISAFKL